MRRITNRGMRIGHCLDPPRGCGFDLTELSRIKPVRYSPACYTLYRVVEVSFSFEIPADREVSGSPIAKGSDKSQC